MHFAIDISQINRDNAGINQYTKEILTELVKHSQHQFMLVSRQNEALPFTLPSNVKLYVLPPQSKWRGGWYFALAKQLKEMKVDALLAPALSPVALFFPKTVMFIYDLAPLTSEQYKSTIERWRYAMLVRLNLWKAKQIVTISKATLNAIHTRYPQTKDDYIPIAYPGLAARFTQGIKLSEIEAFKSELQLGNKILLSVGTVQPRKNYLNVIYAFLEFNKRTGGEWQYVIAGRLGWEYEQIVQLVEQYPKQLRLLTTLSDHQIVVALNAASGFVQLSLEEGFGMPLVEASAAGLPILASDISVFHEIGASNTIYVHPQDMSAIVSGLEQLVSLDVVPAGKKFFARFSWQNSASIVLEALEISAKS